MKPLAAPHGWRECTPAFLPRSGSTDEHRALVARTQARLVAWFLTQPDDIRIGQHLFGCWNRHTVENLRVAALVADMAVTLFDEEKKKADEARTDQR